MCQRMLPVMWISKARGTDAAKQVVRTEGDKALDAARKIMAFHEPHKQILQTFFSCIHTRSFGMCNSDWLAVVTQGKLIAENASGAA